MTYTIGIIVEPHPEGRMAYTEDDLCATKENPIVAPTTSKVVAEFKNRFNDTHTPESRAIANDYRFEIAIR